MAKILVDGCHYNVDSETHLLRACLSLGFDLPYFCWHPAMGSVGACRQCAVKQYQDESDTQGRIVMACMTSVTEGIRIGVNEPEAREFRASVIEWLMVNHPHDCPTCEEGGECHLQDMTQMAGHTRRRYRFLKRTFRNQDLGPFLNHEMNRCITCYRCVRFYRDYAGGSDLDAFGAHRYIYFGRHTDGPLDNEFSGNLVEVCPTGVFTDRTLAEHYVRKWDLRTAPSVCGHCGMGCNISPGARYDRLRRIQNRFHHAINGYFLCDRGRFGYQFVNSQQRLDRPWRRSHAQDPPQAASTDEALEPLAQAASRPERTVAVGSPRASLETNFALRQLVGPERFCPGLSPHEQRLTESAAQLLAAGPARNITPAEAERADAILVLGEDLPNTAPRLSLHLRQGTRSAAMRRADALGIPRWHDAAVRQTTPEERSPLMVATPGPTRMDPFATRTWRAAPADIARLGWAITHELDPQAPAPEGAEEALQERAREAAAWLQAAERPLVVSGTGVGSESVLQASANVSRALHQAGREVGLFLAVPEANSLGVALMGGRNLDESLDALEDGQADTLVVAENDLFRRAPPERVCSAMAAAERVVVLDHLSTATVERAHAVLPASPFPEGDGTWVNTEGRAQRFFQVYEPPSPVQEGWRWLRDGAWAAGREDELPWSTLDEVTHDCAESVPSLAAIPEAALTADFRQVGRRLAREPFRYSGRTAMRAHISVHEPVPSPDPDSPFSDSMEGHYGDQPASVLPFPWAPGWNSVQAWNKFQDEVGGPLRGGPAGVRLLESGPGEADYIGTVPEAFSSAPGYWQAFALHHVFGSEEQSNAGPAVASRAPGPYVALPTKEAEAAGLAEGEVVTVTVEGQSLRLPLQPQPELPAGVAGLPVGLRDMPALALPSWITVQKVSL